MRRQAGELARRLALSAILLLSALLVITPFALAQDSEQSILNSQSIVGLPDVVADEMPGVPGVEGPDTFALTPACDQFFVSSPSTHRVAGDQYVRPVLLAGRRFARGPPAAQA